MNRWTGSYGLVQADRPKTRLAVTTYGIMRGLVISVFSSVLLGLPSGALAPGISQNELASH